MRDHDAGVRVREGGAWGELVFFVCICSFACLLRREAKPAVGPRPRPSVIRRKEECPPSNDGGVAPNTTASPQISQKAEFTRFQAPLPHQNTIMQRLLVTLCLGAASAFAPQVSTTNSLVRLQANPIDIYSAARRGIATSYIRGAAAIGLLRAANRRAAGSPDIKVSDVTPLRSEADRN